MDIYGAPAVDVRRKVGMVFQFHCLFEHLSAIENVCLAPVHAHSEIPQGTPLREQYCCCTRTTARTLCSIRVSLWWRIHKAGIRYSNMVPVQESRTGRPSGAT